MTAGLTGHDIAVTPAPAVPIRYEHRAEGATLGRALARDPHLAVRPHLFRLIAHGVSTFIVVLAAGLIMIGMAPGLFGYEPVVVTSGSMEPTIRVADVVVTAPTDGQNLRLGAVINFEREEGTVLHRITEMVPGGYRTTGDANRTADSEIVAPTDISGVGVVVVPLIGLPRRWVDEGQWTNLAATTIVLMAALHMSRQRWVLHRRDRWAT